MMLSDHDQEKGPDSRELDEHPSCFGRCKLQLKHAWGNWFTHIGLLVVLIGYSFIGAVIFRAIEAPNELKAKQKMNEILNNLTDELIMHIDDSNWTELAQRRIMEYAKEFKSSGLSPEFNETVWTFWGSVFYCGTVYTTIGYGHISPVTDYGRMATIGYAAIGVPLVLMILTDIGRLFTRVIKKLWAFVRRYYYTGHCRRVRRAQPLKMVGKALHLEAIGITKRGDIKIPAESPDGDAPPTVFEIDDEFNLPVTVALVLWLLYLFLGSTIFCQWEEWTFFEAFYFCFISLSTIGLGDITPKHQMYMMLASIYVLIGLALTSMVINVIRELLVSTYTRATTKLTDTIGLRENEKDIAYHLEKKDKQKRELLLKRESDGGLYDTETEKDLPEKSPIKEKIENDKEEEISAYYDAIYKECT